MGWFSRFTKKSDAPPESVKAPQAVDEIPQKAPPRPAPSGLTLLAEVGRPGGPPASEALALFTQLRSTPEEGRAVQILVDLSHKGALPDLLSLPLSNVLADRGQPDVAIKILERATSTAALVLRADLAASLGDVPLALSLIERVLLRNIDEPGAKERLARWRTELGLVAPARQAQAGATVVTRDTDAPFELIRELARGGAGVVYEAVDRELDRHVALKIYHDGAADREQLAHEARVASLLGGRNVTRVFDLDLDHGWLALEWASQKSLRDAITKKNATLLAPLERWALPLAETLARIHREGWVHYDIKPANVLFMEDGRVVLTDFGIAKTIGSAGGAGSLGYVSPERMKGATATAKDDVFGFGRIVEDVTDSLEAAGTAEGLGKWKALASVCTGPEEQRPADGNALVTRIKVEIGLA